MKAKIFSKSVISLILSLMLIVSMFTVGIINASSAVADLAEDGDVQLGTVTVCFDNNLGWDNVYMTFYTANPWQNGSVSPSTGTTYKMEYSDLYGAYIAKIDHLHYSEYISFASDDQATYGNYWHTNVVYRADFPGSSKSFFTPDPTRVETVNECNYYYFGEWSAAPNPYTLQYTLTVDGVDYDINSGKVLLTDLKKGTHDYTVSSTQMGETNVLVTNTFTNAKKGTFEVAFDASTNTCTFTEKVKVNIAISDATEGHWIGNDDATIYAYVGGTYNKLAKVVDTLTGLNTWYAEVYEPDEDEHIIFLRTAATAKKKQLDYTLVGSNDGIHFNSWTVQYVKGTVVYKATGDNVIAPASEQLGAPDPTTVNNFGYGFWVDPNGEADPINFVKIYSTDYSAENADFSLFLPSGVDLNALRVYTSFSYLKIGDIEVTKGELNNLNIGYQDNIPVVYKRYDKGSTHNATLHLYNTENTATMFLNTKVEMYTGLAGTYAVDSNGNRDIEGAIAYKDSSSTKGSYKFYDEEGNLVNTDTGLKKVKGRGNSTYEASMRLFGKYAYNVTLETKAQLIDGCCASKKFSMLANNADESLMRNVTVYAIADKIGMPYTPNTRLVDLYDNGNYLGAYVITEKVEYGKDTLISDAKSMDKFNEEILAVGKGIEYEDLVQVTDTYTAKSGTTYTYQYSVAAEEGLEYDFDGSTITIGEGEDAVEYVLDETLMKQYDFVMEHELATRYSPEATWFISGRTQQAVVPKYPEFATKKEAQWMIETYDALETATYTDREDGTRGNFEAVSQLADVESFASVYLIQELTVNLDAGATSYNILGGGSYPKLLAAPIWDYDWAAGMYNGEKLLIDRSANVSNPYQEYATLKSVKIESGDGRTQNIPNLQARMTWMPEFWALAQSIWTNKFVPVLNDYLGDDGTLLTETLPAFRSSALLNEARWNVLHSINSNPEGYWGTRSTTQYKKGSKNFDVGFKCTGAGFSYDNTVYYLNDWLQARQEYMSNTLKLYDENLIVPEEPNEYIFGDADGDGEITVMDATCVQRILADLSVKVDDVDKAKIRGAVTAPEEGLNILDATAIQRFIASLHDSYGIGVTKTYA